MTTLLVGLAIVVLLLWICVAICEIKRKSSKSTKKDDDNTH
jgi:hypothetical protein